MDDDKRDAADRVLGIKRADAPEPKMLKMEMTTHKIPVGTGFETIDKLMSGGLKRGELLIFASTVRDSESAGKSTMWFKHLKKRVQDGKPFEVVFTDFDSWTPANHFQSIGRLNRRLSCWSRRKAEGGYAGKRNGHHYRSKVIAYGKPFPGTYQVEKTQWRRYEKWQAILEKDEQC